MSVRAKFKVDETTHNEDGGDVTLVPVVGGSEENEEFFRYTPAGSIKMGTINKEVLAQFVPGDEFYVDFTPAPKEA